MLSASGLFTGSVLSSLYAKVRPTVSPAVVEKTLAFLSEKVNPPYKLILDVGCGTGFNTRFFAPHFNRFIGIDVSSSQLEEARRDNSFPNATYEVNDSTRLPCGDESVDMITVIQAAHWLDHTQFFKECDRVLSPNGVLSLMGYSVPGLMYNPFPRSRSALTAAVRYFYNTLVETGSWHVDRYILDRQYRDITLPFSDQLIIRDDPTLFDYKDMDVRTFIDYLNTWSGYREFQLRHPRHPLMRETRRRILAALPGQPNEDTILTVAFPWFLMLCRK